MEEQVAARFEGLQLSRLERTPDKREVGSSSLLKPTKPDAIASGFLFIHSYQFSNSGGSKNSVWVFAFPCVPLFWIIAFIFNMMKNKKTNASTLVLINVLEGIRTPDPRLRRPLLYPAELQTHKRVMGIEPTYLAWKASVLPLNYTRRYRGDRIRTCGLLIPNQALQPS